MLFLNTLLLIGAAGILIPIIIHLLNRRSNRIIDWGAMNFLFESLAIRNRRIQLEEALLMAARCLLVGLLALALARPFVPPGSNIPWIIVLPLILLGVVGLGVAAVLHNEKKWRFWIGLLSVLCLAACAALILFEKQLNLSRFGPGGRQDIALIIDGSTSMSMEVGGITNFERAVEEARTLVKRAPRGHAFSVILGGPTPSAKLLDPTTDRAELEAVLDDLQPLDGSMATYHALTLASLGLARGQHPAKQIILLSDGQSVGWETGKTARWNFLRDAFKNLPAEPQIVLRQMPLPQDVRNLAVTGLEFSREIIGTDRPVDIQVTIENTGNEAVTPSALDLRVEGGRRLVDQSLGQVLPGARETVTFSHQFDDPGAHAVKATLLVTDEIVQDNSADAALNVADSLKVLIVDGRPAGRFFQRAGTFAALALAPSSLTLDPTATPNQGTAGDETDDNAGAYDPTYDPVRFLVEPEVVPAADIATLTSFDSYDVILLADVPRLTAEVALTIREYVRGGGGLLVAPGQKALPEFYNNWTGFGGERFLPANLSDTIQVAQADDIVAPSPPSLSHPSFLKVAEQGKSDLDTAVLTSWWELEVPDALAAETSIGGRLNTGVPFLAERREGAGTVVMLNCALDTTSGNLPTRQAFLPFLHELVYQLADPAAYDLNLDPGWDLTLLLTGDRGLAIGQGLRGEYFADANAQKPLVTRVDPAVQFNWRSGAPASGVPTNNFRIEWTGKIQAPHTDTYTFDADYDGQIEMWIDGKAVMQGNNQRQARSRAVKMIAGEWHDFRIRFRDTGGDAKAILYWASRAIPRQIVPAARFRTFSGPAPEATDGSTGAPWRATPSWDRTRSSGGASFPRPSAAPW